MSQSQVETVAASRWIRRFQPAPDGAPRLVCLPHAGGSSSFYFPVARSLSPAVEVLAVQYPGRQDRRTEANIDNISELVDRIFAALTPISDRPFALFGHSMGATLAYELALRLQETGRPGPSHLFASGRRAPSRHRPENVHRRSDDEVVAEMKLLSGPDAPFLSDPDVLAMSMPAIRADYRAVETYRDVPGRMLHCPVTVLTGDRDPRVSQEEAEAWREHTDGAFALHRFPGGHFFLVEQAPAVLRVVSRSLTGR
ncbi:thioesterase II family protein [Streptomyces sp. NPDC059894]|uniref:thioesterase II family protein n=1 Tax=unclassified Streptomyces TaxID=2593676 RepID=UPI003660221D